MKKITSFVKLDLLSIKPYITLKNLVIFLGIALITSFGNETQTHSIALIMTFTMLYATYPFAVGDQNGIDSLYTILGISKKEVIQGRYAFLLVMNVVGILFGIVAYFLLSLIFKTSIDLVQVLVISLISTLLLSINQFILYPVFFKHGYIKSKSFTFLPLMLIALVIVLGAQFFKGQSLAWMNQAFFFFERHQALTFFGVLTVWLAVLLISYKISCAYYVQREF